MNLTITHRHAHRPSSAAAVTAVVAAAVRAGHTITITTDSDEARYTFALDEHHVIVTTNRSHLADGAAPPWATRLAAAATRLI
jgi:hypothetical protein